MIHYVYAYTNPLFALVKKAFPTDMLIFPFFIFAIILQSKSCHFLIVMQSQSNCCMDYNEILKE